MKKLASIALIFLMSVIETMAQDGAKFDFKDENNTFNFGTVKEGVQVVHEYEFTNIGNKPLQILKVEASCSCTKPEWPKTPVMPGQKGAIKVSFDTKENVGSAIKNITIQSNAIPPNKGGRRHEIILKGMVEK